MNIILHIKFSQFCRFCSEFRKSRVSIFFCPTLYVASFVFVPHFHDTVRDSLTQKRLTGIRQIPSEFTNRLFGRPQPSENYQSTPISAAGPKMLKTPPESLFKVSNGCFRVSFYPPSGMPEFGHLHAVFRFPYLRWLIGNKRPHSRASRTISREPGGSEKMTIKKTLVTSSSTKLQW
jgi:hypothetical protein